MTQSLSFDARKLTLAPLSTRLHDLVLAHCRGLDWSRLLAASPHLDVVGQAVLAGQKNRHSVILFLGAHAIKLGLCRYLIDLIDRGLLTHLATNGAGLIHDFELALVGGTS